MPVVWFIYFGQWSIRQKQNKLLSNLYQRPSFNKCHIVCLQFRKIVKIGCLLKRVAILVSNVCIPRGWVGRFDTLPEVTLATFKTVWPAFTVRGCLRRGRKILEGETSFRSVYMMIFQSMWLPKKWRNKRWRVTITSMQFNIWALLQGGGGILGLMFAGYVPPASQSP